MCSRVLVGETSYDREALGMLEQLVNDVRSDVPAHCAV